MTADRLAALLRRHLPHALAIADPGGSVEDDWTGSEYADVMAVDLAERLIAAGVTPAPAQPLTCPGCGAEHDGHVWTKVRPSPKEAHQHGVSAARDIHPAWGVVGTSDLIRLHGIEAAARAAERWIADDCQPSAEWVAEGHNVAMGGADRDRGATVLLALRAALEADHE